MSIVRIIPARAGFTVLGPLQARFGADHPRSRGVYIKPEQTYVKGWGSSPLARGLPAEVEGGGQVVGIIPARAGFTGGVHQRQLEHQDHPRSRGVYGSGSSSGPSAGGSSPLARGLRLEVSRVDTSAGIIPARAGFTSAAGRSARPAADHPRSRGVYRTPVPARTRAVGSSPLARGLPGILLER